MNRRLFLKAGAVATFAGTALSNFLSMAGEADKQGKRIWANLLHLGHNMWGDWEKSIGSPDVKLGCEEDFWIELTEKIAAAGLNMVVIDLGEAIQYQSHPEIAIDGAWSIEKLRKDLARIRKLGLEPIPKLNFSACHDLWLGEYARMVSTPKYYEVCADLIKEVCEIFDTPRFFHLGYDEETASHQSTYNYIVIRQNELWWHDFLFFVKTVEAQKVRPWIWSDYCWHHKEEFLKRMPKSVLQSNWYYDMGFDPETCVYVQTFFDLDKAGYDQVPAGSNWANDQNFPKLVEYCRKNISEEHLKGFLQTAWEATKRADSVRNLRAIELVKESMY